jgi:carbonic anhydrase
MKLGMTQASGNYILIAFPENIFLNDEIITKYFLIPVPGNTYYNTLYLYRLKIRARYKFKKMAGKIKYSYSWAAFLILLFSCSTNQDKPREPVDTTVVKQEIPKPVKETVLTAEQQKALTPDAVLKGLKDGNIRFVNNNVTARDHSSLVRDASFGQYPKAVILSCLDSRIPVEDVFDKGIGDIFVARVAGNIINVDILASMEYGCKVIGAKLIVVLGHSSCGAVNAAIDNVKMGNITALLTKIKPAVMKSQNFAGDKTSKNSAYADLVGRNNVLSSIEIVKSQSPILKEMIDKGEIKIVGAYYDMKTGEVTFIQ